MKKLFKILAVIVLLCIAILVAVPFFLESKIDTIVKNYADNNLNAEVNFSDVNLSLIRSFPNAEISVQNLKIINKAPFKNETLATAKSLAFEMSIAELFKGTREPIIVNEIIAKELLLVLKTNTKGVTNYDITKSSNVDETKSEPDTSNTGFSFDVKNFEVINSAFTYIDEASKTALYFTEFNHQSKGIFSENQSELDTKTNTKVSFKSDSTMYLNNTSIKLNALLGLDLDTNTYTFKNNKAFINNLPLEFHGFVQLLDNGQNINIDFNNPEASFKDFLAVIPKTYSKNVNDVSTTGNFTLKGIIKGLYSETTIPTLDINLTSNNASFKYPNLPKRVEDIVINASIKNTTGNTNDTFVDLNTLNFKIDDDVFNCEAHIKNLTKNISVNANLNGVLNLANITKAYPIELQNQLSGVLKANLNTIFDMDAIKHNAYNRIKNNGTIDVSNFVFSSTDIVNPIQINTANVNFKPGLVTLNNFNAQTGQTDFSATGTITNVIGFLLSDKKLQGNFKVNANQFAIADFMVEDETTTKGNNKTTADNESLKIPEFLDCTITADAKTVLYDNLTLKNVKGQLRIKDQNANLNNVTTDIFNGKLGLSGSISTKDVKPKFDMNLAMQQFDISQSFKDLKLLTLLAPIAKIIEGKLNSTIKINGLLDQNFTPDLTTISGNALAEVLTQSVNAKNSPLLSSLNSQLNFIDFETLNLKDLKTKVSFNNGEVAIEPFNIGYNDINIQVSGTHSLSNSMNYKAVFNVPAKYLGNEINQLVEKINDPQVENITIPVTANISGTFTKPNVKTNLASSVSNLTNQLIEIQKQKLINKGKDKVENLLGGLLGNNNKETKTDSTSNNTNNNTNDKITKGVKNVLGGLLGGKKKKDKSKDKH